MTDRCGGILTGQVILHNEIFSIGTVTVSEVVKILSTHFIVCDCPVGVGSLSLHNRRRDLGYGGRRRGE